VSTGGIYVNAGTYQPSYNAWGSASAHNLGALGAYAEAYVSSFNSPGSGSAALAAVSNTQALLLDFRNSGVAAWDVPTIIANVFLSGQALQYDRQWFSTTKGLQETEAKFFADVFFGGPVNPIGQVAMLDASTVTMGYTGFNGNIFSFRGADVTTAQGWNADPTKRDLTVINSGSVNITFTIPLHLELLYEIKDPNTGNTSLTTDKNSGGNPTDRFGLYGWDQRLLVGAIYNSDGIDSSLPALIDVSHTLAFAGATLSDGASLSSQGIDLYNIADLASSSTSSTAVPEPSSVCMATSAIVLGCLYRARRKLGMRSLRQMFTKARRSFLVSRSR
jgi:hypothetical protein